MRRFAAYDPECVACLAGPLGDRTLAEGTELLVGALAAPRRRRARGGHLGRLRAGPRDASARWRASSTASPTPTRCWRSPARRRSGSCSTPTTSGTTPRCCPGSRRTSAASSASTSATGRRSTAPTACFPTEGISHTLELVAALVARRLGRRARRRDLLDAGALLGPPGRRGGPPRLRRGRSARLSRRG